MCLHRAKLSCPVHILAAVRLCLLIWINVPADRHSIMETHMVDPIRQWHDEHVRFGQLLDLLDRQLTVFHAGGEPDYDLIYDIVHYLRDFGDRFHHPREDVAFARLAERDADMWMLLNRLLQEHRVIAAAGDELLTRLDDIATDVVTERAAVEAAAATYLVYYRHHLATEETQILPRAAQFLSQEDWTAVAAAVPVGHDPLFGNNVEARYEALRRHVIADEPLES